MPQPAGARDTAEVERRTKDPKAAEGAEHVKDEATTTDPNA